MKKVIVLAFLLASCTSKNVITSDNDIWISGSQIMTFEIDSCEYIGNVHAGFMTHKGNCKYCIARTK